MTKDALEVGDGDAIVGHWHTLFLGLSDAREHISAVEHAGTAVNYQVVTREVGRKVATGDNVDL